MRGDIRDAEAGQRCEGGFCSEGVMAEVLTCVNVGDMDFHGWDFDASQRIMKCDGGVRVAPGIENNARDFLRASFMDEIHQLALTVGLTTLGCQSVTCSSVVAQLFDIGEGVVTVDFRLTDPSRLRFGPFRT